MALIRWFFILSILVLASSSSAQLGTLPYSGASLPPAGWATVKVGAGGQVTGIDVASDGTKVAKTDVGGGYYCPAPCTGSAWIQVINATSMPAGDSNVGWDAANAGANVFTGVYEIRVAPSQTSIFYVYYFNNIYKGTYSGGAVTLVRTAFSSRSAQGGDSGTKFAAWHMAVSPTDSNTVVAGGPNGGIAYTTNGGTSWTAISGLCTPTTPGGASQAGGYFVSFDPNNASNVYIGCYGTGVYSSTTGPSGSFSALGTGGPTTFKNLMVGSDGSVCVSDNSAGAQNLWGFFSSAWTNINSGTQGGRNYGLAQGASKFYAVIDTATDFNLSSVATHCGSGGTWTAAAFNNTVNQVSADIGWISADYNFSGPNMSAGASAALDANSGRLYVPTGTGVIYAPTPATNTGLTWVDQAAPMEELVANKVKSCPGGSGPFVGVWDRGIFNVANGSTAYPAFHGTKTPLSNSFNDQIVAGWDIDCSVTNPGFVVCLCNFGAERSGFSANGGASWSQFAAFPSDANTGIQNGSMAVGDNQTIVWAYAGSGHLWYTVNQGVAWTQITSGTCPNLPAGGSGWGGISQQLNRKVIAADQSLTNTFYLYNGSVPSFYKLTFSGGTPTCVQTRTSALDSLGGDGVNDGFNIQIDTVPGQASNLFYTSGAQTPLKTTQPFWRSTDGGVTWSQVSSIFSVQWFGFGAAKPGGGGYPAIFIYGMANGSTKMGIYRSDDNAVTWNGPYAPCPVSISTFASCPNNNVDLIKTVNGDLAVYGRAYVGFSGTAYAFGTN